MRVLLAFDKFKGCLSAKEACAAAAAGLRGAAPDTEIISRPVADGGEGTLDAVADALRLAPRSTLVPNAVGTRMIDAPFLVMESDAGATGFVEMATASGLAMLTQEERNPLLASTLGTGLVMRAAAVAGATRLVVGLGGSATNEGGIGIARAFGYRFVDRWGRDVPHLPGEFRRVARIKAPDDPTAVEVVALADVSNPLLGPDGATAVYGPQKGVTPETAVILETALSHLADLVARDLGCDHRAIPGAGAAGGTGFGLLAFFGATITPGFDYLNRLLGWETAVREADVVITGEGRLDHQTLHGKAPAGVAALARRWGKTVIAIGGSVEKGSQQDLERVFDQIISLSSPEEPLELALRQASARLEECASLMVRLPHFARV